MHRRGEGVPAVPAAWPAGFVQRVLPALIAGVVLVAGLVSFFVVRATSADQEKRILKERTSEVGLILRSGFGTVSSQLATLGVAARVGDPRGVAFSREARTLASGTGTAATARTFALVRRSGGKFVVVAASGPRLKPGDVLTDERADVVSGVLTNPALEGTPVFHRGKQSLLGFALGPPATPPNEAIYLELPIFPAVVTSSAQQGPFHELNLALYASARPDPTQLVLRTTDRFPLRGRVATALVPVGPKPWLLAASARDPLVGSFANIVPWLLLGAGLVGALLVGAVVLMLQRRRDYALMLVDERTDELESSLLELRDTQTRLLLQQRLAAIGQVAAAVGHELRNPLGVMTNALYLLKTQLSSGEEERVHRHLETTEREIAAATAIVESLLGFARERPPVLESIDLPELLDESLSVAPPPANVQIVRAGLDEPIPLQADRQQLRQVLLNLLTNAYEAMDGHGTLTISARPVADEVEIRLSDTGPGLDEQTAGQIFEPFFTNKVKGIGLGLAVTKQIVDGHGGTITAEGRPGAGATFVLTLPNSAVLEGVR